MYSMLMPKLQASMLCTTRIIILAHWVGAVFLFLLGGVVDDGEGVSGVAPGQPGQPREDARLLRVNPELGQIDCRLQPLLILS